MKPRMNVVVAVAALFVSLSAASQTPPPQPSSDTSRLISLETSKWNPASLSNPKDLLAMFADDFVSVEYGADTSGGVQRKSRAQVFSGPPLPPAKFTLSDWQTIQASPDTIILSYRVTGQTITWKAYATSVWARRNGQWQTVLYQASTAK